MTLTKTEQGNPWYKEPWGWMVFGPLIFVVCACAVTVSIAFINADDVVKDQYSKNGKVYEKDFSLESYAASQGIRAQLDFDWQAETVRVYLSAKSTEQLAQYPHVLLQLLHPLQAELDHSVALQKNADGRYSGVSGEPLTGRWYVELKALKGQVADNSEAHWRLKGEINFDQTQSVRLH